MISHNAFRIDVVSNSVGRQTVQMRNLFWSIGIPPAEARSLKQRLDKLRVIDLLGGLVLLPNLSDWISTRVAVAASRNRKDRQGPQSPDQSLPPS